MTTGGTAAGWYADAGDARLIRWWDGAAWTEHTQPNPAAPVAPLAPVAPAAPAAPIAATTSSFAQPTGSIDLASVDYEPMTRTWGSGRAASTQRSVTGVTTAGAWMLALWPLIVLGLAALGWVLTEGGTSSVTSVITIALAVAAVLWVLLGAVLDFRRLGALGHEFRPSVAWVAVGPLLYLIARGIHVHRTTRSGTAPTWIHAALTSVIAALAAGSSLL